MTGVTVINNARSNKEIRSVLWWGSCVEDPAIGHNNNKKEENDYPNDKVKSIHIVDILVNELTWNIGAHL